ncbi:MAG: hypothetical protein AEth_01550 [Candidatus Argoarchaeum ethanivorans]|uniref:Uncharacterized protein n=1 Tax=Candidatus Argoarchaeum ethanivorans TaxID=2608793 RepID=A0A8B3RZ83_9EURY|nr:MAG: hypothetical protein AEth_01550 [Candidatus Argoarchaeum ethanivorans]
MEKIKLTEKEVEYLNDFVKMGRLRILNQSFQSQYSARNKIKDELISY